MHGPVIRGTIEVPPDEAAHLILSIAREHNRESFAKLFVRYAPKVKGFLVKLGTPTPLADELAQETLLAVWRKATSFDPAQARASTWIYTIARNLRTDMLRGTTLRQLPDGLATEDFTVASPVEEYICVERVREVSRAMSTLSVEQAEVIRLSFFEEMPHPEIAVLLDIPLGTVKSRIRLAFNRLRASLREIA